MKKTPSHFTACVEIEWQISFFSFGFARVTEVRHISVFYNVHLHYSTVTNLGPPSQWLEDNNTEQVVNEVAVAGSSEESRDDVPQSMIQCQKLLVHTPRRQVRKANHELKYRGKNWLIKL